MGYGRSTPKGSLPVFSVGDDEEARRLITMSCPTDIDGNPYARELVGAQTLENLEAFSTRLDQMHDLLIKNGVCHCDKHTHAKVRG